MRAKFCDPVYRQIHTQRSKAGTHRAMQDPQFIELRRQQGREIGALNINKTRSPESRARAGKKISAVKLAAVPSGYRELYRALARQNIPAAERLQLVLDQQDRDRRAAVAEIRARTNAMHAKAERERREAY